MTAWYCDVEGRIEGPLTSSQLVQRIRDGVVKEDTPIRKDDSQWVPAIEVNGLFAAAAKPVVEKVCPYCGCRDVTPPPSKCPSCERNLTRLKQHSRPSPVTPTGDRNPDAAENQTGARLKSLFKRLFD